MAVRLVSAVRFVSDALWSLFSPLLSCRPPRVKGGRPPLGDRAALTGIVFVLKSGIPWGGHPLGDATAGDGLRLRHDLLAAVAGLAERGPLASPPSPSS